MIRVSPRPEYPGFDREVRQPGRQFLERHPNPAIRDFRQNSYWRSAGDELYIAYAGICAYTAIHLTTGDMSIDHFLPKSKYPLFADEWSNLRLTMPKINSRKGDSEEVVEPFEVAAGWFVLDLPNCLVRPGTGLSAELEGRISKTIEILQLNADDRLVQNRCALLMDFAKKEITIEFLDRRYPFLALEIRRQNLEEGLDRIMNV